MKGYPLDRVRQEVAFLGRHVHWTLAEVLSLDHAQRRVWVLEIAAQFASEFTSGFASEFTSGFASEEA